jgi:ribonuclease R
VSPQPRRRRPDEPLVAVLEKRGRFLVAEPLFSRGGRVAIDGRGRDGAGPGDLVLVGQGKRGARVAKVLGRPHVARHVLEGLMLDRGLHRAYARAAVAEAERAVDEPFAADQRVDLRDLPTFTVDPEDAKDFDDAISAREEQGFVRLWVHIADVTAYVRPGGALEREALRRATSVYVPGAVEPMLPEVLSNRACSLRQDEDRLAVTVEMEMHGTEPRSVRFHRSIVRSDARLIYGEVDAVFEGHAEGAATWAEPLAAARRVAGDLRALRDRRGALEVDSREPTFRFDDEGNVVDVEYEEQSESHRMIEELMVLANEQVAGYLEAGRFPTLYRVHERPDPSSVEFMIEQLASLEVPTPAVPRTMSPQQAAELAAEASRMAAEYSRQTGRGRRSFGSLVLRSLKQALYTPKNLGHAGLASSHYCHFTSPIRRYPDIVAHRALLQGLGIDSAAAPARELEEAGVHSSASEREAMKIERDADDVCAGFLLERKLSDADRAEPPEFEGEVVGTIEKGAFVTFGEEGFEGFVPVRRLRGWWHLNELGTMLEEEGSGRTLRIGDPLVVTVDRVDAPRGRVDLAPAGSYSE